MAAPAPLPSSSSSSSKQLTPPFPDEPEGVWQWFEESKDDYNRCRAATCKTKIKVQPRNQTTNMLIATVLDPLHKSLSFLSSTEGGKCIDALKAAYARLSIEQGEEPEVLDDSEARGRKRVRVNHPDIFHRFHSEYS
ncbi:MAG: hypothetical protein ACREBW_10670 [Candidatus Micrarchaeaceae archaeon]